MKADPKMEMKKIVKFLDVHTDYESKYDCLFGDNSLRFKRSSYREYDPYLYIDQGKFWVFKILKNPIKTLLRASQARK